jgi:F420-dependent oxidoreductase-like protein
VKIGITVGQQATLEATLAGFEQAEQLGVHSAWFSQPPGGFDALMVLALAAGRTRTVRLGTAAIPTYPRHPVVTARAAQTIAAAAPGRTVLGVSSGHRTWIENEYGLAFDRPVRHLTDWIRTVRRLLRGEALAASDNPFQLSVPGSDTAAEVPIVLAATGPQLLAAGGSVADGILTWMGDEAYLAEIALPAVTRGAARAQRPVPPVTAGVLACVSDDAERARAALRPRLAALGQYDSYRAVLAHGTAPREPADVAVIGAEDDVRAAFGRLAAAGAAEVTAVVLPDPADPAESVRRGRCLLAELAAESLPGE